MSPLGRPIPTPPLLGWGRVKLRLIAHRDARTLRRLLNENRNWLQTWEATHPDRRGPVPGSVPMGQTIRLLRRQRKAGTGLPFVILFDSEVVGQLSVSEISGGALQCAQLGYWVSEHVAGKGIAPTAVALTIDHLFTQLGLHRVEVCIRPNNTASLRVAQKLGLRYEGRRNAYIHINGAWQDHDCFALTREEAPEGVRATLNTEH